VKAPDPANYAWWLASRSAGIVAFTLVAAAVTLGLSMSTRLVGGRARAALMPLHEQLALGAMAATGLHGALLLGDSWLRAGVAGVLIPFDEHYRPLWTGIGVIAAYLAGALGLSFYARRRIGARRWRSLHRFTIVVYVLALAHLLGAGSDSSTAWMWAIVVATASPIAGLLAARLLGTPAPGGRSVSSATARSAS
jgi:methionine sulfoxide reductase heme-binding subunit